MLTHAQTVSGLTSAFENPQFSTAIGLIKYARGHAARAPAGLCSSSRASCHFSACGCCFRLCSCSRSSSISPTDHDRTPTPSAFPRAIAAHQDHRPRRRRGQCARPHSCSMACRRGARRDQYRRAGADRLGRARRRCSSGERRRAGSARAAIRRSATPRRRKASEEFAAALDGAQMVFLCVGLGGGTGSGAARLGGLVAREQKAARHRLRHDAVHLRGPAPMAQAEEALAALQRYADVVICFENDRMGDAVSPRAGNPGSLHRRRSDDQPERPRHRRARAPARADAGRLRRAATACAAPAQSCARASSATAKPTATTARTTRWPAL